MQIDDIRLNLVRVHDESSQKGLENDEMSAGIDASAPRELTAQKTKIKKPSLQQKPTHDPFLRPVAAGAVILPLMATPASGKRLESFGDGGLAPPPACPVMGGGGCKAQGVDCAGVCL